MLKPSCAVKLIKYMLAVSCFINHWYSTLTDIPLIMLCSGTYTAFILIFAGEIIAVSISAKSDPYVDLWYAMAGLVLFAASGGLTLRNVVELWGWSVRPYEQTGAVCAIILSFLMIIEAVNAKKLIHSRSRTTNAST